MATNAAIRERKRRRLMCGRKHRYASQREAIATMRMLQLTKRTFRNEKLNVYLCPFCGSAHIGHVK